MKTITYIILLCCLSWTASTQVQVSQIEGYLETYHPDDTTSLYLGKGIARNVDNAHSRNNTIVGGQAGRDITTGGRNTFFGVASGKSNTTGSSNSYFGVNAGRRNTEGFGNACFGHEAGINLSGSGNVFIGNHAGSGTLGSYNTFLGNSAGAGINGDSCIALGVWSGPSTDNGNVSRRLYIDVERSHNPLIYGEFDNDLVRVNGGFEVIGDGDNLGGVFNANEVVSRFKNTNSTSDHSAISVDGQSAQDAIVYLAEEGDAYWDVRHDVSQHREFQIRYQGGDNNNDKPFRLDTFGNLTITGSYFPSSDVNRKESIQSIDHDDILSKVIQLPITEWQYKGNTARHIGPMAQDFYAAFGFGKDETTIATIDADGVALAAIQAQQELIEEQQKLIEELLGRIENLEELIKK